MQARTAHERNTTRRRVVRKSIPAVFLVFSIIMVGMGCDDGDSKRDPSSPSNGAAQVPSPQTDGRPRGPNVILITLDTVRADALGVYGQTRPTSPELDRLAREGVIFDHVATAAPSTLPSHASIMTGLYPFAHGARSNSGYTLSQNVETLAEALRAHGYRTGAEIAAPVLNATTQLDQGFEHYQDLSSKSVEKVGGMARGPDGKMRRIDVEERDASDISRSGIRFIAQHEKEPFFLWLHYFDPHRRYAARAEYDALIPDSPYHAEIRYVDTQIANVIHEVEARGLRAHTLVVIVADHGEGLGEHGETTHSEYVYDTTIHVPLIFWGPADVWRSDPIESLARTVDVAPTILDYLGLPNLPGAQGVSLRPQMRGEASDPSLAAYGESIEIARFVGGSPLRFLRRGNWKYIHKLRPELYDLADDPHEERNLAEVHPEKVRELRSELEQLIANAAPAPRDASVVMSPEQQEQLQALGYLTSTARTSDFDDALDSTELHGPDPSDVVKDVDDYARALACADNGDHEGALALLRPLVDRHPDSAEILSRYAASLLELDENRLAREALSRVLAVAPCSVRDHQLLGEALHRLHEEDEALDLLRRGAVECPDEYTLLNNYAYALATQTDPARRDGAAALLLAERALQLAGGESPAILDTVAAAQAETGNYLGATVSLRRALALLGRQDGPPALRSHLEAKLDAYEEARATASAKQPPE